MQRMREYKLNQDCLENCLSLKEGHKHRGRHEELLVKISCNVYNGLNHVYLAMVTT